MRRLTDWLSVSRRSFMMSLEAKKDFTRTNGTTNRQLVLRLCVSFLSFFFLSFVRLVVGRGNCICLPTRLICHAFHTQYVDDWVVCFCRYVHFHEKWRRSDTKNSLNPRERRKTSLSFVNACVCLGRGHINPIWRHHPWIFYGFLSLFEMAWNEGCWLGPPFPPCPITEKGPFSRTGLRPSSSQCTPRALQFWHSWRRPEFRSEHRTKEPCNVLIFACGSFDWVLCLGYFGHQGQHYNMKNGQKWGKRAHGKDIFLSPKMATTILSCKFPCEYRY